MSDFWSVDEHLADILRAVRPLDPIELQLLDAHGCVLVEDVTVPAALPPFDNSSMDGYAVRTADVEGCSEEFPAVLTVIGDIAAGSGEPPAVGPGEAARIMTGAPLPPGAEAVVPVEWTDGGSGGGPAESMQPPGAPGAPGSPGDGAVGDGVAGDGAARWGEVRVFRPVGDRAHIRDRGSDVAAGTVALTAGTLLGAPQVGLLAAIGRATVRVLPRPRVVVVSTGSELAPPGAELRPGQIHDSNSYALAAAAREAGAEVYRVTAVADDAAALRTVLEDQLIRADLIVTSGGVSVGAYDVVKEALGEFGGVAGGVEFRKLAMQPGKPQGFGLIGESRIPLLALPGNPVSSYVSFELFVRPALRLLAGRTELHRPRVRARLEAGRPLSSPPGRRQFLRGVYRAPEPGAPAPASGPTGGAAPGVVRPVGGAGSHLVGALAQADALLVIPEDTTEVEPGEELEVVLLGAPG